MEEAKKPEVKKKKKKDQQIKEKVYGWNAKQKLSFLPNLGKILFNKVKKNPKDEEEPTEPFYQKNNI